MLRARGIAAAIAERDDQIAHRRKKPGRPIDFGEDQKVRYRGRNVVERCLQQAQAMARHRDALRQDRPQLPRRYQPGRHTDLNQDRLDQHGLALA
jgi:hypothetical protein